MSNERGQALLETVIILPIFLLLVGGIIWFTQILVVQTRLLMASRHGVWLLSNQPSSLPSLQRSREEFMIEEVKNMLSRGAPSFKRGALEITCQRGWGLKPDRVEVTYTVAPFSGFGMLPRKLVIREHCDCLAGTWYLGWPGN